MPDMPDAIVLCGGAGTRLRGITGDAPKSMASIAGRPFLELLLRQLRRHGFQRVTLAVGRQSDMIGLHFGHRTFGLDLVYSAEPVPLGTGGALGNAAVLLQSDTALVTNGDSYTDVDLSQFVIEHRARRADLSLVVVPHDGRGDCGVVSVDRSGKVEWFREKSYSSGTQYVNAGVYIVPKALLSLIPPGIEISLEKELLPQWLKRGMHLRAFVSTGECVDIGTPDRYCRAQRILANAEIETAVSQSNRQQSNEELS